ncbi:MAG TPA: aldehyde dehydrogenase [Dokdonella sp.]
MNDAALSLNFIDGRFIDSTPGASLDVINPANLAAVGRVVDSDAAAVDAAVDAARRAQPAWARLAPIERAGHLRAISARIRDNQEALARLISTEQGKVLPLARVEVAFTADYIDYMAEWARRLEGEILTSDRATESILLLRKPLGVVAGILPWNFPFFLIARKLAPALLTGNTIVVKPSEETPLNACEFARLVAQTDLPDGVFNLVNGRGATVGARLSEHPGVNLISFTGSVETGSRIMQAAGRNITRVNLELGGKAPVIVLADADLALSAKAIWDSRITNTGQLCNCAERIYVQRAVAADLGERLATLMADTRYGDPFGADDLHMGPLINRAGLDKVDTLVKSAIAQGARVLTGGSIDTDAAGFHFRPTVLADCRHDMDIMRKEIFGPVIPIQAIEDLDEGIALANDSPYGLTSSLFTRDLGSVLKATRELQFGETYVNREHFEAMQGFHAGRRQSGIGGADGKHGLYAHLETHVVYLNAF